MIFISPWPPALAVVPSSAVLVETLPKVAGLVKLTVVFGAERLYHLNGFWKSKRKVAVARSLIFHSFDAENWQSMKRCRSNVLRPTLPRPYCVGIAEVIHRLDQAVLRGLREAGAADVLPVVAQGRHAFPVELGRPERVATTPGMY